MLFEFAGVAYEPTWGKEGLNEVDDSVGTAVLPLAVGEHPVEPSPFRGLAGVVIKAPVVQRASDLITCPTFAQQTGEGFNLTFGKFRANVHLTLCYKRAEVAKESQGKCDSVISSRL